MVKSGDTIILRKPMGACTNVGEKCKVQSVIDGVINFTFGGGLHLGCMSADELEKYFTVCKAPTITDDDIEDIIEHTKFKTFTVFDKCTVVVAELPNGFILTESSACVSPENYDADEGYDICFGKIEDKIWELEGYRLQQKVYEDSLRVSDRG
jgi:hypothetical protein